MYTTVGPRCGIAAYTQALVSALSSKADVTVVPIHPGSLNPFRQVISGLRLNRNDVIHLQHTYSFFGVDQLSYTILLRVFFACIRTGLVLTAHTVREPGPRRFEGGVGSGLANALGAPAWHDRHTFLRADAVIVHCEFHRTRLISRGIPSDRIHVIPPGIPGHVPVTKDEAGAFRFRFRIPRDRPVVGVFGFLENSKRYGDLLEAVNGLEQRPIVLIAGGPRLPVHETAKEILLAEAKRFGLEDRLVITGYLDPENVPAAFEVMDIVVVPYATDQSMSYSLHRALGQGRPVVATDLPTVREVQARGSCLALVPSADPAALRETLACLLADAQARARLAASAKVYAAQESMEIAARRTLQVYALVSQGQR